MWIFMFILWGLWISSTTTEPWVKMRAHIKAHIKSKLKSRQHIPISIKNQKCWSKDIYGSKNIIYQLFHSDCISYIKISNYIIQFPENAAGLCKTHRHNVGVHLTKFPWFSMSQWYSGPLTLLESPGTPCQFEGFRVWTFNHFFSTHFIIRWTKISKSNSIPLHTKSYDLFMLQSNR